MTPSRRTTSNPDDEEKPFDFSPRRDAPVEQAGATGQAQASAAPADDASPDTALELVVAYDEVPAPADAADSPAAVVSPAIDQVVDGGLVLPALPDTSLIRLDQFRVDHRFSGIDGRGVSVVVIDTGIDLNHDFFGADADNNGVADRIVYSYDFSGSNDSNASDTHGHGSNVASIVGSQDGLYRGMAPGVNIIALKVFPDGSTSAANSDIQEALSWVVANAAAYNVVAVNMSLGQGDNSSTATSSVFASQMATLVANNVAVVVSSGNAYFNYQAEGVSSPSADPSAWSVGAVWDRDAGVNFRWSTGAIDYTTGADQIVSFSQRSTSLTTIFAPGGRITGASHDGGQVTYSGTSQAAPHISGLVADMQQLALQVSGHFLSVDQLKQQMIATSVAIFDGDNENDNVTNTLATYHRVDALAWGNLILDELFAGTTGNDTLNGTVTADTIHGAAGGDILKGNGGNDRIDGGAGGDTLTGGTGRDVFVYALGGGADTIADFSHAEGDKLDFGAIVGVSRLADVLSHATQVGSDTVIDFGAGDTLTLKNVTKSALVADDLYSLVTIESTGATRLVQIADAYALYASGQSTGPDLRYAGASVTAGQFGGWAPIAAEASGSYYRVVWELPGAHQFKVWTTDGFGNYQYESGVMSATSYALESLETSFAQDFNGDGTIGVVTTTIEMSGIYGLVLVADTYWMGSYGWAELRYGGVPGTPVTVGQFGAWDPIALEPMAWNLSYKVVWKHGTTDQYLVWTTDAGLNYLSQTDVISGSTLAFQSMETTFAQDLNGDGTIGPATSVIESAGATRLVQIADTYALQAFGGPSGPSLYYGGAIVTTATFGTWAPIGAEAVVGGYQVTWKQGSDDLYAVWLVDGSGNLLSSPTGIVSASNLALQALETGFGQDLNGDGATGYPTLVLEAIGATTLVQIGSNYHVYPAGGSSGPLLYLGGAAIAVGQFGAWVPTAAEAMAGGYQVAWKMGSADQYAVWSADAAGNLLSSPAGIVSGGSATLQASETGFGQDLNGDGTTGLVTTVIEALGWTTLVQRADIYALYPSGGSSGPELRFNGSTVTEGQFGAWTPIAAEATPGGYQVVWKMTDAEQYAVWLADASGNLLSSPTGVMSADSPVLQSLEVGLRQDLNGDGTTGVAAALVPALMDDGWHL